MKLFTQRSHSWTPVEDLKWQQHFKILLAVYDATTALSALTHFGLNNRNSLRGDWFKQKTLHCFLPLINLRQFRPLSEVQAIACCVKLPKLRKMSLKN